MGMRMIVIVMMSRLAVETTVNTMEAGHSISNFITSNQCWMSGRGGMNWRCPKVKHAPSKGALLQWAHRELDCPKLRRIQVNRWLNKEEKYRAAAGKVCID